MIYHNDDVIPKSEYFDYKQVVKSKGMYTLDDILTKLNLSFNKISNISIDNNQIIIKLNSNKYTFDNLYDFVSKAMYRSRNVSVIKDINNNVVRVFLK